MDDLSERRGREQGCMTRLPVLEPCVEMRQARPWTRMGCSSESDKEPNKGLNISCVWK